MKDRIAELFGERDLHLLNPPIAVRDVIKEARWYQWVLLALFTASVFLLWGWIVYQNDRALTEQFGNQPKPPQIIVP